MGNAYFGFKGRLPTGQSTKFAAHDVNIARKFLSEADEFRAYASVQVSADDYALLLWRRYSIARSATRHRCDTYGAKGDFASPYFVRATADSARCIELGGYSGNSVYKNKPAAQSVHNHGPIPAGQWTIGGYTNHKGQFTITLTPKPGTNTFGRSNFRIHGDSIKHPGAASDGCIILSNHTRLQIVSSGDTDLEVVP